MEGIASRVCPEGEIENRVGCWREVMGDQGPEVSVGFCSKWAWLSSAVLCGGEGTGTRSPRIEVGPDLFVLCHVPSF